MITSNGITNKAQRATDLFIANTIIAPIEGYNWHKAMLEAGYAKTTVRSKAKETWDLVGVQSQIKAVMDKIRAESVATRHERQQFWTATMHSKDSEGKDLQVQMSDRLRASELLGKSEADFTDVHAQQAMQINIVLPDNYNADKELE